MKKRCASKPVAAISSVDFPGQEHETGLHGFARTRKADALSG